MSRPHSRLWWAIKLLPENLRGVLCQLGRHGVKFLPALYCRISWFVFRRVPRVKSPEGLIIETYRDLMAYWSFFIQSDLSGEWQVSLKPGEWVIDIGANRGWFRDYASTLCRDLKFIAFEPQKKYQKRLERPDTRAYFVALGDREGTVVLQLFNDADGGNTASLVYESSTAEVETVPMAQLDSFTAEIEHIHTIKIDVDGAEIALVRGGLKTLAKTRYVICEVLDDRNLAALKELLPGWSFQPTSPTDYLINNPLHAG